MKKQVKWILVAVAVLVIGAGAYYTATAPVAVEAVTLSPQTAEIYFTAQGVYTHTRLYHLTPVVSGSIDQLGFKEGETIEPGQMLMRVSVGDIPNQIRQLESVIAGYEAQIAELENQEAQRKQALRDQLAAFSGQIKAIRGQRYTNRYDGDALEANIDAARLLVANNKQLVEDRQIERDDAQQAYDIAQNETTQLKLDLAIEKLAAAERDYRVSLTDLDKLQKGDVISDIYFEGLLDQAYAQEEAMKARLEEDYTGPMRAFYSAQIAATNSQIAQLRTEAGRCSLIAPVGGVIVNLPAADTNLAVAGQPVAEIGIGTGVEVFVPQREMSGVWVGQQVTLTLEDASGDIIRSGQVAEIEDKAEVQISALGVEERRVRVVVTPDEPIPMGYAVEVKFPNYVDTAAIMVPKTALFTDDAGRDCVFVIVDSLLVETPVEKGVETRTATVIDSGLSAGDVIVKDANLAGLGEGRKVTYPA